jgi:3-methyladenine DNA glycosylase AlkC
VAEPLKNRFGPDVAERIGTMVAAVYPAFDKVGFVADALDGFEALELTPRARQIAEALARYLPTDFAEAAAVLKASMGPLMDSDELTGMETFIYLPHVFYVADHGLDHFDAAMDLQYELTQRFTAEFSIRAYLERHPEQTLAVLRKWAGDPSPHVRRLVSEGTRPRLPWASRLREFQRDPAPVIELLELLKDDPALYVRRSVANNLNDIGKDHPDVLLETCKRWWTDATPEREWLIRHALRSAVKRGDPGALDLFGAGDASGLTVSASSVAPAEVSIGDSVLLEATVVNESATTRMVMMDFRVHFVKADGRTSPKVFKGASFELEPGAVREVRKRISLKQRTTRIHYVGRHAVEVIVNGTTSPLGAFDVTAVQKAPI